MEILLEYNAVTRVKVLQTEKTKGCFDYNKLIIFVVLLIVFKLFVHCSFL